MSAALVTIVLMDPLRRRKSSVREDLSAQVRKRLTFLIVRHVQQEVIVLQGHQVLFLVLLDTIARLPRLFLNLVQLVRLAIGPLFSSKVSATSALQDFTVLRTEHQARAGRVVLAFIAQRGQQQLPLLVACALAGRTAQLAVRILLLALQARTIIGQGRLLFHLAPLALQAIIVPAIETLNLRAHVQAVTFVSPEPVFLFRTTISQGQSVRLAISV
jgi:hypothetical protein